MGLLVVGALVGRRVVGDLVGARGACVTGYTNATLDPSNALTFDKPIIALPRLYAGTALTLQILVKFRLMIVPNGTTKESPGANKPGMTYV